MARTYLESGRQRVNTGPATLTFRRPGRPAEWTFELWLPTRERMSAIIGHTRPVAAVVAVAAIIRAAAVVGRAAVIDRATAIVAVGIIIVATAVGGGDRNA